MASLSPREKQVLKLIIKGLNNLEISQKLKISDNTVKVYVRNILQKLNAKNRAAAAVKAIKNKLSV